MTHPSRLRLFLLGMLLAAGGLCGCVPPTVFPVYAGLGLDVAIFHRTAPDLGYSAVTGLLAGAA